MAAFGGLPVAASAQNASARLVGVGIVLAPQSDGRVQVTAVLPGGPAAQAGIRVGDELLSVNGRSAADIDAQQLVLMIRGEAGTEVALTVRTPGERPRQLRIRRAAMTVPAPQQGASGLQGPVQRPAQPGPVPVPASRPAPGPRGAPGGVLRFTRVGVRDPGINNIEAVSFLVPAGWRTEGGVQWFPDYSILANLLMKITDPQSGAQIEFLPIQNFTWLTQMVVPMQPGTNYMGNILAQPITDVPAFIRAFYGPRALRHLQGARQVAVAELPRFAAEAARQLGGQGTARSARVRYEYAADGRPWTEDVFVTLTYFPWQLGTLWSVSSAYAFRAPSSEIDRLEPTMATTVATLRLGQEWFSGYMYVQKLFTDRMNQGIRNARALSDTITRNSEEIRRMYADSYRQRSESQDRISQGFSEYIRGVDTYRDPFEGRPVQLPSGYQDAWVNSRGEYLLSNSAGFNPNVGDTVEWRRMDPRVR
jgi:hypothetical protein